MAETPKKQLTLSPAVASAAKKTKTLRASDNRRKEQLSAQVLPAKPPPRKHDELLRAGLVMLQQQLRAQLDESVNREALEKEYHAQCKVIKELTTKRDNYTKNIKERSANLRLLQDKLDHLPVEVNVRLELAKVEAVLNGEQVMEVDDSDIPPLEWNGGTVFPPASPMNGEECVELDSPEEGEVDDQEEELRAKLLQ